MQKDCGMNKLRRYEVVELDLQATSIALSDGDYSNWSCWRLNADGTKTLTLAPNVSQWLYDNVSTGWFLKWQHVRTVWEIYEDKRTPIKHMSAPCLTFMNDCDLIMFRLFFPELCKKSSLEQMSREIE